MEVFLASRTIFRFKKIRNLRITTKKIFHKTVTIKKNCS